MKLLGSPNEYRLLQWANDWMTVAMPVTDRTMVLAPNRLRADGEELETLKADRAEATWEQHGVHRTGFFWRCWAMTDEGIISRRPDAPPMLPPPSKKKKDEDDE